MALRDTAHCRPGVPLVYGQAGGEVDIFADVADLTKQQRAAVEAVGDVLVMAGAGTGKTHTLVKRVLHFALHAERPIPLDRFLIVTFTEAAAAEMKRRLAEAVIELQENNPQDSWLEAQRARLDHAMIGTLHAYCLNLLQGHFHELGLDPAVHTLDEAEAEELSGQALARVFEPHFAGTDVFSQDVRDLWVGQFHGDSDLAGHALRCLHKATRALENPLRWRNWQAQYWSVETPDAWRDLLLTALPRWAKDWYERFTTTEADGSLSSNPNLTSRLPHLRNLAMLAPLPKSRAEASAELECLKEHPNEWPAKQKSKLRPPLKRLLDESAAFAGWLTLGPNGVDPLQEDWDWSRRRMQTLLTLLAQFDAEFARRKRERSGVDFADQEQFALDLLGRENEAGRTAIARVERERFDLVLIDECQDLNAAQDAVLRAISRSIDPQETSADPTLLGNRFLVGDVKQSIYRFRLADPAIFQSYARNWVRPGLGGQVLTLTENFRSAAGVLGFVNGLFPWLMREELGGVSFGTDAALQFGAPETRGALADSETRVEINLRIWGDQNQGDEEAKTNEGENGSNEEDRTKMECEARLVAARLGELHQQKLPVWDSQQQQLRPVRWSDMAVLLRGKRSRADDFAKAFSDLGVPLQTDTGGFFERCEVRDLLNLVTLFDNPFQDIPLLGVLRSPLVGLYDVNQLAAVRLVRRATELRAGDASEYWWTLLRHFVEVGQNRIPGPRGTVPAAVAASEGEKVNWGPGIFEHPVIGIVARSAWERVDLFLRRFSGWRQKVARGSVSLALEAALDDTGFEASYRSRPDGAAAHDNIQRFLELARQFDRRRRGGASEFIQWLARQAENEAVSPALAGGTDAVSLLTIHKSKGLEFPVVAVAALGASFNDREQNGGEWIMDPVLGLAPRIHPPRGRPYPGPSLWLAQRRQRREQLGEELRLLYVAMTRAVDRLLLFGTTTASKLGSWNSEKVGDKSPLRLEELEGARNPLAWLAPALSRWTGVDWQTTTEGRTAYFQWKIWPEFESPAAPLPAALEPPNEEIPSAAEEVPSPYRHLAATREPAKATVTGLRKRLQIELTEEVGRLTVRRTGAATLERFNDEGIRFDSTAAADITAVERGLLHHRFMEHVDLSLTDSREGLASELERLTRLGRFTSAEAGTLDTVALTRFWNGKLGNEIRRRAREIRRELPFTLRLGVDDLTALGFHPDPGLASDEFVVVQGVIDLVCLGGESTWVLDFKTDRLHPEINLEAKAAAYAPQLALYALAVQRLFGGRVSAGWLHFLATGDEINVLAKDRSQTRFTN